MHAVATFPRAALGITTHDNVPKVVIISQGTPARNLVEKARLKPIPLDQSRLRREIKETARCLTGSLSFMNCENSSPHG